MAGLRHHRDPDGTEREQRDTVPERVRKRPPAPRSQHHREQNRRPTDPDPEQIDRMEGPEQMLDRRVRSTPDQRNQQQLRVNRKR